MNKTINLKAHAKINIFLDIKGRYPNGYHRLDMIMLSVGLCDRLKLEALEEENILISTNGGIPFEDKNNLIYKAISALKEKFCFKGGVLANIEKNIPSAAGLGGGSADCAAALRGTTELFGLDITEKELFEIGAKLGADVPFCLYKNPARAEGIGEILTAVPDLPPCSIIIVKPPKGISTPEAFGKYDRLKNVAHPDIGVLLKNMAEGNLEKICGSMGNVLEEAAIPEYPLVGTLKEELIKLGASGSLMSGSGSAVFGIFKKDGLAKAAYDSIKKNFVDSEVFITHALHAKNTVTKNKTSK